MNHYLSLAISYILDSGSHGATGLSVSPLQRNYLVYGYGLRATGYGLRASNHGVVRFLHKPCSASAYVNMGFIKPYKRYRATHGNIIKKVEVRKKDFS